MCCHFDGVGFVTWETIHSTRDLKCLGALVDNDNVVSTDNGQTDDFDCCRTELDGLEDYFSLEVVRDPVLTDDSFIW